MNFEIISLKKKKKKKYKNKKKKKKEKEENTLQFCKLGLTSKFQGNLYPKKFE
jgi:hypothetical protein